MSGLLDLVLPVRCLGCGGADRLVCGACLQPLAAPARATWPRPAPPDLPAPYAVAAYRGSVRALLLAYKEDGVVALRRPLGAALASAVWTAASVVVGDARVVRLVPVPSGSAARRRRGDDVVRALARSAAHALRRRGVVVDVVPALSLSRRVADSAGLTAEQRVDNLVQAFVPRRRACRPLVGAPVVLVDDIITTGATLAECARALSSVGVEACAAATVAATQRRFAGGLATQGGSGDRPSGSAQARR
jgi:predicted amidophosphoribosyltransferase